VKLPLFLLVIAALAASACGGGNSTPTGPTPPSAPYSQTDLRVGTGAEAVNGRTATVNYTGWFYNPAGTDGKGNQFDTSATRGPLSFVVGTGNVIQGWHRGVPGMRVGGLRRLVLPPELAYGSTGGGPIPPNATLVFDIELLAVQ
jgi:FKBP-type peptidyl-prolyl cis-trans isomerase FkpA